MDNPDIMTGAEFSKCGRYRYALWRFWNYRAAKEGTAKAVMFILANASAAGKFNDDPTIVKCAHYGRSWGYDGMYIGNLWPLIETHWVDENFKKQPDRMGAECDYWLDIMKNSSALHIAGWGFMGDNYPERAKQVADMFPELYYLELSKKGIPKHPRFLSWSLKPILWERE